MESIILAAASAAVWLWILRRYDRIEPEPLKALLTVGILGGLLSIVGAFILNTAFGAVMGIHLKRSMPVGEALVLALFVGLCEETMKGGATLLFVRNRKELNEPVDGMVYGMTVALGFAALENLLYMARNGTGVLFWRSLSAVPGHLVWGAFIGFGMAKTKFLTRELNYFRTMMPYVLYAVLTHAAYDFFLFLGGPLGLVSYVILGFLVWDARKKMIYLEGQTPFLAAGECPTCRAANRPYAKFCKRCGTSLKQDFYTVCHSCTSKVPHVAKFCPHCGAKLQPAEI